MNFLKKACRSWGQLFVALGSENGVSGYFNQQYRNDELIGLQSDGAPTAKLLGAIVGQAQSDKLPVISFEYESGASMFGVLFWSGLEGLEPSGEKREVMSIPSNLATPLFSHALWILNHQDPIYQDIRGALFFDNPSDKLAVWSDKLPPCRCWLRDPKDVTSLVIQTL